MELLNEIEQAHKRIRDDVFQTPLLYSNWLSDYCSGDVYLKLESEQITGSFKARGSLNKLKWIKEQNIKGLPVTASTGNHGLGFARACDLLGIKGKVFLPHNAVSFKVESIRAFDVEIEFHGDDPYTTETYARKTAEQNEWIYVSPYNDHQIVAGQGTIGIEILNNISNPDNIFATVGGGGLISGIGSYVKAQSPATKIIGCQPENSPEMSVSVQAGEYREVESKPTLSDGSAGGFERNSITFELCRKLVDDFILISEDEIADSIRSMIKHHSKLVEGSAGVAIASLLKYPERFANQTTVIVVCGANISADKLQSIIC
ncbi:serine/threonine dehydratase [Aliifodinibius salipaludis]|uniref:Serine/threonine dehydratase n=1 Tax=Fodinibius salipaludis TaxID=2032627 RepID=A0A2A2G8C2_9BACT|nr:threonine/serine dehydratase [Aliifodinibius salipaludis]PAU93087.1 serine/threonine dehydratase [Aliifodinibius salipaludis]